MRSGGLIQESNVAGLEVQYSFSIAPSMRLMEKRCTLFPQN